MSRNPTPVVGAFPQTRLRRNRQSDWVRRLVQENELSVNDLIWPVFVIEGKNEREAIASMPGVERLSIDLLVEAAKKAVDVGIPAMAIFPNIDASVKDEKGSQSIHPDNLVCRAVRAIKDAVGNHMGVMCDVALDPFTSHGHDGIMVGDRIDNDLTLEALVAQSLNQAEAGCDILGPSDMMDGRVGAIRKALEEKGCKDTIIMSYATKYASAFYGPFRDAVGSKSSLKGDKRTYQQDPANSNEGLREVYLDLKEGADMVMVKPGIPYLDMVCRIKETFTAPTYVYHVSGEYAMLKAAEKNGWIDGEKAMLESLLSCKRAGADGILTYAAFDVAQKLKK